LDARQSFANNSRNPFLVRAEVLILALFAAAIPLPCSVYASIDQIRLKSLLGVLRDTHLILPPVHLAHISL
jgi:hypothetical protein